MPIKRSAFKRLRQDKKKHERNKSQVSEIRTLTKKTRASIAAKKREEAETLLKKLESKLDRAAKRNLIKKNNASRNISRLRKQLSAVKS
jgi:small subunit ribosomal protein S20